MTLIEDALTSSERRIKMIIRVFFGTTHKARDIILKLPELTSNRNKLLYSSIGRMLQASALSINNRNRFERQRKPETNIRSYRTTVKFKFKERTKWHTTYPSKRRFSF